MLLDNSVNAEDHGWWKDDVYSITESTKELREKIKNIDSRMASLSKSGKSDKDVYDDLTKLMDVKSMVSELLLKSDMLAALLNMAGYSNSEDRPAVVYELQVECLTQKLETPEKLENILPKIKGELRQYLNEVSSAIVARDKLANKISDICKALK
jgi:chaperonin cofactor prefoldin